MYPKLHQISYIVYHFNTK